LFIAVIHFSTWLLLLINLNLKKRHSSSVVWICRKNNHWKFGGFIIKKWWTYLTLHSHTRV